MQRCLKLTLLLGWSIYAVSLTAVAQRSTPTKSFEVASVRIATSGGMSVFPNFPSATLRMENMPMTVLIAMAYGMSDDRLLNGPSWLGGTLYSVQAKPEGDTPMTEEQYQPLMQDLLRRRFHLAVHRETRQLSGYELMTAKGGPKLTPAPATDAMCYILANGLECESANSASIASLLARPVGHPVVDKTGLSGSFKLKLRFAAPGDTSTDLPDIFTAVQEQLGLRLESHKVPADFLVIDHVDKIPTEN
jgi:uncharacterized protein (TIGR03435 family)